MTRLYIAYYAEDSADFVEWVYERGVHFQLCNYQLSLVDVTHAVELESDNPDYHLAQGHLYYVLRQYENAYDAYSTYLSLLDADDDPDPDALMNITEIESRR